MKFRGTLLFVVLTVLLSGFYLLYQRPQAAARKAAAAFEKRFFRAATGDIWLIVVENRDGRVEISHGAEGWMIEKPQRYRPDDGMIRKLLETIAGGQLIKVVGETTDLSQFGFDQPILSLTLGIGQKRDVLVIGQKNPTDTGYYAYSESLGKIFLVNKELPKELYMRLYDLREKRLFPAVSVDEVGRIVISRGPISVDIANKGGWQLRSPFAAPLAGDEMKRYLENLVGQKAAAFIPWEPRVAKVPQQVRLQLFDLSGRALLDTMVYYLGTGENEGVVVHAAGAAEAVRTPREFWEVLGVDPSDLLERGLFPRDSAGIVRVSLVGGGEQIVLEKTGGHWQKNGTRTDDDRILSVLDTLRNWKAIKVVLDKEPVVSPRTVIEVDYAGGKERLTIGEAASHALSGGLPAMDANGKKLQNFPAASTALARTVLVGSHELERIIAQLRQIK